MSSTDPNEEEKQKEAIKNTFNTVANAYGTGACRFFHISGQTMADLHKLDGNENILDVASGTGAATIPLSKKLPNGNVTAVDFSPAMLEQAKIYAHREKQENIDFQIHDMTRLPFSAAQFDHANCAFGLFFVDDIGGLLNHIGEKIKPGGRMIVSGFCGQSFLPQSDLTLDSLQKYGVKVPEQRYRWRRMSEPGQLFELFESAGFKDVSIHRKSLGYYISPESWWEVLWNAGFRGLLAQLNENLEKFKQEHIEQVRSLADDKGLWLEIDVNFTTGYK